MIRHTSRPRLTSLLLATGLALTASGATAAAAAPTPPAATAASAQASAVDARGRGGWVAPAPVRARAAALALGFYQPFRDRDVDALDRVLARDWVDEPLGEGQQPGRDGFKPVVVGYRAVFPDLRVAQQAVVVSADARTVTVRSTFTGTQRAPFLGIPATGAVITFRTTDVHEVRGGRIVHSWHLEDLFGAEQQMLAAGGR